MLSKSLSNISRQKAFVLLISVLSLVAALWVLKNSKLSGPQEKISRGVMYLEDSTRSLDISDVQVLSQSLWQQEQSPVLSFAMTENPYWFTFELEAINNKESWLLELDYALLDQVSVWFISEGEIITEYHVGDSNVFAERPIKHEKFLFSVPTHEQGLKVVLRVQSGGAMRIPLGLWQESSYVVYSGEQSIAMGLFFGFMAAMGLSNFFFFITTRINTFFVYSAYVLCLGLTLAALHGLGYKYLWPNSPWLQEHSVTIFANATIFFVVIFTDLLLDVRAHSRKLSLLLRAIAGLFLFCLVTSLFLAHAMFITAFLIMLMCVIILICSVGIWLWAKGVPLARFYTLAWIVLFVSGFVASLDNLHLIRLDISYHYLLMIGASIETLLLALVLAVSYGKQRQDSFEAQELALKTERTARTTQEELLGVQDNVKQALEYSVQERTLELEIALRELSETNRELEEKNTLDALTGIRNRRYFDKKYTAELRRSRRERTELSVMMIDIDHFKKVNDEYGHLVGDECIKFVATVLKEALKRPSDDVCRYGGEEFVLLLPSTDLEGASSLAEVMRQRIEESPVLAAGLSIPLSISTGIATVIAETHLAEEALLSLADQQLYSAKNAGRNRVKAAQLITSANNEQDPSDV